MAASLNGELLLAVGVISMEEYRLVLNVTVFQQPSKQAVTGASTGSKMQTILLSHSSKSSAQQHSQLRQDACEPTTRFQRRLQDLQ
jgi:hypothetical protein